MSVAGYNPYENAPEWYIDNATGTRRQLVVSGEYAYQPPVITNLTPGSAKLDDPEMVVTATGIRLVSGSVVIFDGRYELTDFVPATGELVFRIRPYLIARPGQVPVVVRNPDGQLSAPFNFNFGA